MKKISLLIIPLLLSLLLLSCKGEEEFTTDTNAQLTFSTDTVFFDTIFSTVGSTTKTFKIYNTNKQALVIQSIKLLNPSESGFRINIDGEQGSSFSNVVILGRDSLFGFVEVTVNPQNTGSPVLIHDFIRFVSNGNTHYVLLEAIGQDVHLWKGKTIASDTTLTNDKPYLIYDSLTIQEGATVNIGEGVHFFFQRNASLQVYGTVLAEGTVAKPIVLRASRYGLMDSNIPYDNVSGQWRGVFFHPTSFFNRLANVHIRNSEIGIQFYSSLPQQNKASLNNTIVHNTSENGLSAVNCTIDATNCLFSNSRGAALHLIGGKYTFLHCTISNYYSFASRLQQTLILSNMLDLSAGSKQAFALTECSFINSIVYGSITNELKWINGINGSGANVAFNYQFINCVLKTVENSDAAFVHIIWNTNPLFEDINKGNIFAYNFELTSLSPAIDKADRVYSLTAPYDIKGNSRLQDTNPDMGCYEYIR